MLNPVLGGGCVGIGSRAALAFGEPALEQRWRRELTFSEKKHRRAFATVPRAIKREARDAEQRAHLGDANVDFWLFRLIHLGDLGKGSWRSPHPPGRS